ncbi:aluminum-activated malate transporter 10-like [Camellia sinensis]|uniref:aluminum-activated malate transporter 10-like n=1 Tax=Camellia sinensis TaxID=4442 RepID=UPI001036C329|nr:aluminum-activated malate transporter 10-like [Camellia sinensis]
MESEFIAFDKATGKAEWLHHSIEDLPCATLCKSINRATGTFLASSLDFAVLKMTIRPFFTASTATFSRFIPSFKSRFDYGAMIFVLTFSLVSVSSYHVDRLFAMAHHRVATIVIGTTICILTSMIFCPVWAGNELHFLINRNMEKLADSLDGCVAEYFNDDGNANEQDSTKKDSGKKLLGNKFKKVLTSADDAVLAEIKTALKYFGRPNVQKQSRAAHILLWYEPTYTTFSAADNIPIPTGEQHHTALVFPNFKSLRQIGLKTPDSEQNLEPVIEVVTKSIREFATEVEKVDEA